MSKFSGVTVWKNVPGFLSKELDIDQDGNVFVVSEDRETPLLAELKQYITTYGYELVIEFFASGSYEPQSWELPESISEDRELWKVTLNNQVLPQELAAALFEFYKSDIDAVELDCEVGHLSYIHRN